MRENAAGVVSYVSHRKGRVTMDQSCACIMRASLPASISYVCMEQDPAGGDRNIPKKKYPRTAQRYNSGQSKSLASAGDRHI